MRVGYYWLMLLLASLMLWAVLIFSVNWLWHRIIPSAANVARWQFDYLVMEAEARTAPCLRPTGPGACPRPEPLVPNYCPFPVGGN